MAPAPKKFQLTKDDVPDAPAWFTKVLEVMNPFTVQVTQALAQGLTFGENFQAQVKEISFTAPEPVWTAPSFQNSWVNFGSTHNSTGYRILPSGRVLLRGLVKSGTIGTTIFTLPVGYRPARQELFACNSNDAFGSFRVETDGDVVASVGDNAFFCLDGASFDATTPALPTTAGSIAKIAHTLPSVGGVLLLGCRAKDVTATESSAAPVLDWAQAADGSVDLKAVHGLTPGKKYTLKLLLLAG